MTTQQSSALWPVSKRRVSQNYLRLWNSFIFTDKIKWNLNFGFERQFSIARFFMWWVFSIKFLQSKLEVSIMKFFSQIYTWHLSCLLLNSVVKTGVEFLIEKLALAPETDSQWMNKDFCPPRHTHAQFALFPFLRRKTKGNEGTLCLCINS